MIKKLNQEWEYLRFYLKQQRRPFDDEWRNNNKNHKCDTKVYAYNGEWFCHHLTIARENHFKKELNRIEDIISLMVSTTK